MLLALFSGVDIFDFLASLPILIPFLLPSLVLHEVSHGWVANRLGDPTARQLGRLTLNPISHLDRGGTLAFLIIGIGFAKPVPVNPFRLNMDPRKGMALVAAAGPLSNIAIAAIFSIPFRLDWITTDSPLDSSSIYAIAFGLIILYNLILGIFNLMPIPPFDGYRITVGLLPREYAISFSKLEKHMNIILVVFLALVFFTPWISYIISGGVNFFSKILTGGDLF